MAQFRQGARFHTFDEVTEYVIKDFDLIAVQSIAGSQKQIGYPPQRVDPTVLAAALNRLFKLGDK
ncbi:MAG: hypothetical protein ABWX70_08765 [Hyphomicrobium sp.]